MTKIVSYNEVPEGYDVNVILSDNKNLVFHVIEENLTDLQKTVDELEQIYFKSIADQANR